MQMQLASARCYPMPAQAPAADKHEPQALNILVEANLGLHDVPNGHWDRLVSWTSRQCALRCVQGPSPQSHRSAPYRISIERNGRFATRCGRAWKLRIILGPRKRPLTSSHGPFGGQARCHWVRDGSLGSFGCWRGWSSSAGMTVERRRDKMWLEAERSHGYLARTGGGWVLGEWMDLVTRSGAGRTMIR